MFPKSESARRASRCRRVASHFIFSGLLLCGLVGALHCAAFAETAAPTPSTSPPRELNFRVGVECLCAACAFDTQRALKKFPGVQKVTLSTKERRLTVVFREGDKPVSALALALAGSPLGKEGALEWPAPDAVALAKVPGVASARFDDKKRLVLLTFAAQPGVTLAQLDAATRPAETAASPTNK